MLVGNRCKEEWDEAEDIEEEGTGGGGGARR